MAIAKFVLDLLMKIGPGLYKFIVAEIDGGTDAEELRNEKIEVSIAFGGKPGKVILVQEAIETEMSDPNAE